MRAPRVPLLERYTPTEAAKALDPLVEETVDLCGLSLGALVALLYAVAQPDRVRRLVLCAGFARLPGHLRALQGVLAAAVRLTPRRLLVGGAAGGVPEPYRDDVRAELLSVDGRTLARTMRRAAAVDLRGELAAVRMPTLVLCGAKDRLNIPLSRALAAELTDGRFELVPEAGHVANLDNPDAFNAALERFVRL